MGQMDGMIGTDRAAVPVSFVQMSYWSRDCAGV